MSAAALAAGWRAALDTAARFDVRNGTAHQTQVRELIAATPLIDHLPLSPPPDP
jgi:hypothetical protein